MKRVRDRLKELDHKLYESLMRSHEIAWNEWLPALSVKHDSYNSFPHIRNLEMYLDTVVQAYEENNKREFFISAVEIYIILASILFHDIGKVTSSDKHASESSLIICGKSELLKLPGEPKKTNHKVWASLGIPSFELALSIGRICEYHDIEKEKDKDKKNNLKKTLATICIDAYGEVRQKALASLLMLLDHLDSAHTRIMPEYLTGSGEVKVVGAFRRVITGVYIDLKTNIVRTVLNESLPDGNESEVSYKLNCSSINASLDILKKWAKKSGKTYKTIFDLNNFTIRKPEDLQTIIDEFDQLFNEPDISIPQDLSSFLSELKSKPKNYKYIESFFTSRDDKSSLEGMIDTIVKLWKEYEYYLSTQNRKVPNEIMAIFRLIQKIRKNKTDGSLYSDNGDAELYETLYRIYTKLIGLHKNIILQAKKVPEDIKAFFKLVKECISANWNIQEQTLIDATLISELFYMHHMFNDKDRLCSKEKRKTTDKERQKIYTNCMMYVCWYTQLRELLYKEPSLISEIGIRGLPGGGFRGDWMIEVMPGSLSNSLGTSTLDLLCKPEEEIKRFIQGVGLPAWFNKGDQDKDNMSINQLNVYNALGKLPVWIGASDTLDDLQKIYNKSRRRSDIHYYDNYRYMLSITFRRLMTIPHTQRKKFEEDARLIISELIQYIQNCENKKSSI